MLDLTDKSTITLAPHEAAHLGDDGYVVLQQVLAPATAAAIGARLDALWAQEGDAAGAEFRDLVPKAERLTAAHLGNLLAKDPLFAACVDAPRVLGAVRAILGDRVRVHAVNARNPLPGGGEQDLHNHLGLCNTIWLIDPMTPESGPTRVVPGSHIDRPREAVTITAERGDVVVLDPRTMHGGTTNTSSSSRRVVTTAYSAPEVAPQVDLAKNAWRTRA